MEESQYRDAIIRAVHKGVARVFANMLLREGPAANVQLRGSIARECPTLPHAVLSEQVEPVGSGIAEQSREHVVIMVPRDRYRVYTGVRKSAQSVLQRPDRLERLVLLVDDVAADREQVDSLGDGEINDRRPGVRAPVRIGHFAGASPNVDVAGTENANCHHLILGHHWHAETKARAQAWGRCGLRRSHDAGLAPRYGPLDWNRNKR